jgi:uncharacterized damage-inducible protein DinB
MSIDTLLARWKDVREGLIAEAGHIPAEHYPFCATPETRSVAAIIQHIIETQKVIVGEVCRPDTNLMRQPFPAAIQQYAPEVGSVSDKEGLLGLLNDSGKWADQIIRSFGEDALQQSMKRFDGVEMAKMNMLNFMISHEMYHRGQITVYERLLGIEPALTIRFRKMFAAKEA